MTDMLRKVRFAEEASCEFRESVEWYESRARGPRSQIHGRDRQHCFLVFQLRFNFEGIALSAENFKDKDATPENCFRIDKKYLYEMDNFFLYIQEFVSLLKFFSFQIRGNQFIVKLANYEEWKMLNNADIGELVKSLTIFSRFLFEKRQNLFLSSQGMMNKTGITTR